ncbi:hypothetical protein [Cereibacter sphaeroides]|uniref:hypothetical protein n=1 Tax=Cereibacter sphaeroides TaxID=1063 RepID=UPI001F2E51F1|nr:hypothetical protein [Cereibacter sphaeroides]MCE6967382.1 hypothetical protein [Cereibacter sphaeroides]
MNRLVTEAEAADLPAEARVPLDLLAQQLRDTKTRIDAITADLRRTAEADETARRLQAIPAPSRPAFWRPHSRTCRPSARPAICLPGAG